MDCDWMIACDSAYFDAEKKACLIGLFDGIGAKSVPATHPRMFVMLRMSGNPNEQAEVTVELVDPPGNTIATAKGTPILSPTGGAHIHVRFDQFPIRHFGVYSIKASIRGTLKRTTTLVVTQVP